ncbi:hypothetical protein LINPERPRIM_LOCUS38285 [Linum perenne]
MANNFFLVLFWDVEDYQCSTFGGPWKIYDYYISVARWSPALSEDDSIGTIMPWVRLHKLHIHYFNSTTVNYIGNYIGKMIWMDLVTSEGARAKYARVCVEVDLFKQLPRKYMTEDPAYHVEYESIENVCLGCDKYG